MIYAYMSNGDIPNDVTVWTLPDTIDSVWLDKQVNRV